MKKKLKKIPLKNKIIGHLLMSPLYLSGGVTGLLLLSGLLFSEEFRMLLLMVFGPIILFGLLVFMAIKGAEFLERGK